MLESSGERIRIQNLAVDTAPTKIRAGYQAPVLTPEQWNQFSLRYQAVARSYDQLYLAIGVKYGFPEQAERFALGEEYLTTYHKFTGRMTPMNFTTYDESLNDYARRLASVKLLDPDNFNKLDVSEPTWKLMVGKLNLLKQGGPLDVDSVPYLARDLKVLRPDSLEELGINKTGAEFYRHEFIFEDEILTGSFGADHQAIYRMLYGEFDFALPKEALLTPSMEDFTKGQIEHLKRNHLWDILIRLAFNLRILKAEKIQVTDKGLEITDVPAGPNFLTETPVMPNKRRF